MIPPTPETDPAKPHNMQPNWRGRTWYLLCSFTLYFVVTVCAIAGGITGGSLVQALKSEKGPGYCDFVAFWATGSNWRITATHTTEPLCCHSSAPRGCRFPIARFICGTLRGRCRWSTRWGFWARGMHSLCGMLCCCFRSGDQSGCFGFCTAAKESAHLAGVFLCAFAGLPDRRTDLAFCAARSCAFSTAPSDQAVSGGGLTVALRSQAASFSRLWRGFAGLDHWDTRLQNCPGGVPPWPPSCAATYLIAPHAWAQYSQMVQNSNFKMDFIPCISFLCATRSRVTRSGRKTFFLRWDQLGARILLAAAHRVGLVSARQPIASGLSSDGTYLAQTIRRWRYLRDWTALQLTEPGLAGQHCADRRSAGVGGILRSWFGDRSISMDHLVSASLAHLVSAA